MKFYIAFPFAFTTEFEYFILVEQSYYLSVHRLSDKMCTFVHRYFFYVQKQK